MIRQMADSVKRLVITGGAIPAIGGGKSRTRKVVRGVLPRALPAPVASAPVTPVNVTPATPANVTPATPVTTSVKDIKIILAPSKRKTAKVVLAPVKTKINKLPGPVQQKGKTFKVSRRIRVSVSGFNKRLHRAKTIKKESAKMPIEKMKGELIEAGLIKKESKAPEAILRTMYADFQMLKQRAL
jgi:hypothetical protein